MRARALLLPALFALPVLAAPPVYQTFPEPHLRQGRVVWLENCEGCHGHGVADAPIPMEPDQWAPRLRKERAVLHAHAINGYFGPDNSMMPARGGNPELSDEQVKAAVDYMVALATYYFKLKR